MHYSALFCNPLQTCLVFHSMLYLLLKAQTFTHPITLLYHISLNTVSSRPFPSSPGPLFQNEGGCSAFDIEIVLHSHANKIHFHKKVVHLASF